jgi:hypothetical protein
MTDNTSDLSDDIVQSELPQHDSPSSRKFRPWHKVRKQYIREKQWNILIRRYIDNDMKKVPVSSNVSGDERALDRHSGTLRCLAIPGDDLLDLRSLWNHIQETQFWIRYLGFNRHHGSNQPNTDVSIASNDLNSKARVAKDSSVVHGPFQTIKSKSSKAYQYLCDYGPFNVVNLDFCESLFPTSTKKTKEFVEYLDAILRLVEFQMHHQTNAWLLFVTTEVAPREVDHDTLAKLCKPTIDNCQLHSEFRAELQELLSTDVFDDGCGTINVGMLSESAIADLFGVAFGKLLLRLCNSSGRQGKVQMLQSHKYVINEDGKVSMLSLAYKMTPLMVPPIDPTGLSTIDSQATSMNELDLALRMIKCVKGMSDVDVVLKEDIKLHEELLMSSASLMETAGYDRDEYLKWASSH